MMKKTDDMFSRFDRIPTCDGRTDGGQTSCHGTVRAMHTCHTVKDLSSRLKCCCCYEYIKFCSIWFIDWMWQLSVPVRLTERLSFDLPHIMSYTDFVSLCSAVICCMCMFFPVSVEPRRSAVLPITVSAKGHTVRYASASHRQVQRRRWQFSGLESFGLQPVVDTASAVTVRPDVWQGCWCTAWYSWWELESDAGSWQSTQSDYEQQSVWPADQRPTSRTGCTSVVLSVFLVGRLILVVVFI